MYYVPRFCYCIPYRTEYVMFAQVFPLKNFYFSFIYIHRSLQTAFLENCLEYATLNTHFQYDCVTKRGSNSIFHWICKSQTKSSNANRKIDKGKHGRNNQKLIYSLRTEKKIWSVQAVWVDFCWWRIMFSLYHISICTHVHTTQTYGRMSSVLTCSSLITGEAIISTRYTPIEILRGGK